MTRPTIAPYGSWASPIRPEDLASSAVSLREPQVDDGDLYWLEGRPSNGGRQTVVRRSPDGAVADVTPAVFNARTRVHEYGGASYLAADGVVYASSFTDGRVWRFDRPGAEGVPVTPAGAFRYADFELDPRRRRLYAIREDHTAGGIARTPTEARNELVAIDLDGPAWGEVEVLVTGPDFVAAPRLSPDGGRLAWLSWNHPAMPWDATELWVAEVRADRALGPAERVAGGPDVSVLDPVWAPDGSLLFVADWTGWWNLYRWSGADEASTPLAPAEAEFSGPLWVLGRSDFVVLGDASILAICRRNGRDALVRVPVDGSIQPLALPYTELDGIRAIDGMRAVLRAGAPDRPTAIVIVDAATGLADEVRRASTLALDPASTSMPRSISFPTGGGETAYALYYPPANEAYAAPQGELPPLYVECHGGPTSSLDSSLSLSKQFLTSRGIAVLDVDYRGSTGYGRAYRQLLNGAWGIVDLEDAVAAARYAAREGLADPSRMAIAGGSAGGYTTLRALTAKPEAFAAGISWFGVADLGPMTEDTHKFESRYLDSVVGPWPEAEAVYRERSPIHAVDRITAAVLLLQGLDDRVVPPAQTEMIESALRARRVPVAALYFEGEGHGFRSADAIIRSSQAELAFLAAVFGFTPADDLPPLGLEPALPAR